MYTIKTLNSISAKGLDRLPSALFTIEDDAEAPEGILVRSAKLEADALPETLLGVARAGAGVNNIAVEACTEKGIVVFNTPGANANAVKELVLGGLVLASRNVAGGMEWVKTIADKGDDVPALVEKGKAKFVGPEFAGKTIGIIGLGAIGVKVANMCTHLGMEVLGYDPFISVDAAWSLSRAVKHSVSLSDIISQSDYISLHLPVNKDTRDLFNKESIAQMKQGARILNFARGELVDDDALLTALKTGRIGAYVTDFPNAKLIGQPGVVCIPHLGASTPESEDNCAVMAADQMKDFLVNGNIVNSVNFPTVSMPRTGGTRLCVIHKNSKGLLAGITTAVNAGGSNIDNMTNKSRGDYAYTVLDIEGSVADGLAAQLLELDGIVRVRVI